MLAILLALLAQTSVYGLMIALALGILVLAEALESGDPLLFFRGNGGRFAVATAFVMASIVIAALHALPAPGRADHPLPGFPLDLSSAARTLAIIAKAFLPIPAFSHQFWNSSILRIPYIFRSCVSRSPSSFENRRYWRLTASDYWSS